MAIASIEMPEKIYQRIGSTWKVRYQDIIADYENSFEYEQVWEKASSFKKQLISDLSNG